MIRLGRLVRHLRGSSSRGLEREDQAESWRVEARQLGDENRWLEAAERWHQLVDADPTDAQAHRELARSAGNIFAWGGSIVGGDPGRFVSSVQLAAEHDHPVARDPLGVARRSIERAAELRPDSEAWLAPLAELREADGDLDGAIEAYERAVAASAVSHSAWVVRSRHLWQFELERAHHRRGTARVDDPLFTADLVPEVDTSRAPSDGMAGVFRARFTHQGLNVGGFTLEPGLAVVEVALDGVPLRRVNVGDAGGDHGAFDMVLRRPVLDVAPRRSKLTVTTSDGRRLLTHGSTAVEVELPEASGRLDELLAAGVTVDKKGGLTPTAAETAARQVALLGLYGRAREAFAELDRELFVLYGTLLGVHREGSLIPGDDDLDCGYVARGSDPASVKADATELIEALVRGGFSVSFNRRGRLFRVHHDALGDATLHLDVHPIWFEGPDLYVHNHHRFPASVEDLLPAEERALPDGTVLVPRHPEVLLERFYGPGWRTPDPGYVDDSSGAPTEVMARLNEALLTPTEYRDLAARLDDPARRTPVQGRLVSIALQSLYPLEHFVE